MKKPRTQTEWQQRNKDKVNKYNSRYRESKIRIGLTIDKEVAERISAIKDPSQSYGEWLRQIIDNWRCELMLIFCQKLNCPQNSFTCSKKHFKNVSFLTCLHPHHISTLRVGNYAKLLKTIGLTIISLYSLNIFTHGRLKRNCRSLYSCKPLQLFAPSLGFSQYSKNN